MIIVPRPKYQVFISSTYADLHDEREAVAWAVLTLRHIPAGMENFTAANERGWKTIQRVIDTTDYYVLLLAGRYGELDENTGISWTEREYDYAVSKGIPVLAFIRSPKYITADKMDVGPDSDQNKRKLEDFVRKVQRNHLCVWWDDKIDLANKVTNALTNHIHDDEDDENRRPGWFRGDQIQHSAEALAELARLSKENADLRNEIEKITKNLQSNLVLICSEGDLMQAIRIQKASYELSPAPNHKGDFEEPWAINSLEPSWNEVKQFLSLENARAWVHFVLSNTGTLPAKDITVDFLFDASDIDFYGEPPRRIAPVFYKKWATDPSEHQYVNSVKSIKKDNRDWLLVRHRIKSIQPGSKCFMVNMGLVGLPSRGGHVNISGEYTVSSDTGEHEHGAVGINIDFTHRVQVTKKDVLEWEPIGQR